MIHLAENTIGEVVASNFHTAQVFTKYGIDFCCKGGISIAEVCANKGISVEILLRDLESSKKSDITPNYQAMDAKSLIEHIVSIHHRYVLDTIPILNTYLEKIAKVHGKNHPELLDIRMLFEQCNDSLQLHIQKEERFLFPYIVTMQKLKESGKYLTPPHFVNIENPIKMMEMEHEAEGTRMGLISKISNNYTLPADACQTYQTVFLMLKEFEQDLHIHIHIENNILFPMAKEMFELLYID